MTYEAVVVEPESRYSDPHAFFELLSGSLTHPILSGPGREGSSKTSYRTLYK